MPVYITRADGYYVGFLCVSNADKYEAAFYFYVFAYNIGIYRESVYMPPVKIKRECVVER